MKISVAALVIMMFGRLAAAAIIDVPGDHPTIQRAIDAAANGDTIRVAAGIYPGTIDTRGKRLIIEGSGAFTRLDPAGAGPAVTVRDQGTGAVTIRNLTIRNAAGLLGGGIFVQANADLVLRGVTIQNCNASSGGAVFVTGGATLDAGGCNFQDNTASNDGGGIAVLPNATAAVFSSVFSRNHANDDGGAMYASGGEIGLFACDFSFNSAENQGGAIAGESAASVGVASSSFIANDAGGSGGAISVNGSELGSNSCVYAQNTVDAASTGAVVVWNGSHFDSRSDTFDGNDGYRGTAVSIGNSTLVVNRATFKNNTGFLAALSVQAFDGNARADIYNSVFRDNSHSNAGAVQVETVALGGPTPSAVCVLANCLVAGNQSDPSGATGAIWAEGEHAEIRLLNTTVAGNGGGGVNGVRVDHGLLFMRNSIVWGNEGDDFLLFHATHDLARSIIGDPAAYPGPFVIGDDPLFQDPAAGNYRLDPRSPALDFGANTEVPRDTVDDDGDGVINEFIALDLDGSARIVDDPRPSHVGPGFGSVVDLGPYELLRCTAADIAPPYNLLDLADVVALPPAFTSGDPLVDFALPYGVFDLADVLAFVEAFTAGCP